MKLSDGYTEIDINSINTLLLLSKNSLLSINLVEDDPVYGTHLMCALNDERVRHGQLSGLYEDDHPQYLDQIRHLQMHNGILDGTDLSFSLDGLLDVQVIDPQYKQILKYNGSYWSNAYLSHSELANLDESDDHKQYLNEERHNNHTLHNYYNTVTGTGNVPHDKLSNLTDVYAVGMRTGQVLVKNSIGFVPADLPTFNPNHTHLEYLKVDGSNSPTANLNMDDHRITNLAEPVNPSDAATKSMVDAIVWRKPVIAILSAYPANPINGDRYAISHLASDDSIRGQIIEYKNGWVITAAYYGNAFFNIQDKRPYYWNGSIFNTFGNTVPVEGFLLADGSTPLSGDWTTGNHHIKSIDSVSPEDLTTRYDLLKKISEADFTVVIDIDIAGHSVPYPQTIAVGDRYIASWASIPSGGVSPVRAIFECYSLDGGAKWLVTGRKKGKVAYSLTQNQYYWCDGSSWQPFEQALDIRRMNYNDLSLIHGSLVDLNVETDHPQYLFTSGNNMMLSDLNLNTFRIKNIHDGTSDSDAVNLKQLMLVANGIHWISPVDAIGNDPNTSYGRMIVGTEPTGVFIGHSNDVATYNGSTWSFYTPSESDACLVNTTGAQYIYNGEEWVKYLSAVLHSALADASSATNHARYIRNDADGTTIGLLTFQPVNAIYPFVVPITHAAKVNNLNSDRVDNYHVHDDPLQPQASRLVVTDSNKRINAFEVYLDKLRVCSSGSHDYIPGVDEHDFTDFTHGTSFDYYGVETQTLYITIGDDATFREIRADAQDMYLSGFKVITEATIGSRDADTVDGQHASDFAPVVHTHVAELTLNDLKDVDVVNPEENYVLTYDKLNTIWKAKKFNEITSLAHAALAGLLNDDHTQYLTSARHQAILHQFGRELPLVKLSNIEDIINLGNIGEGKALIFNASGKLEPKTITGSNFAHNTLVGLDADDHPQYFKADGTRPLTGGLLDFGDPLGDTTIRNIQGAVHYLIQFGDAITDSSYGFILQCTYDGNQGIPSTFEFNSNHLTWLGQGADGFNAYYVDPVGFSVTKAGITYTRGVTPYIVWHEGMPKDARGALIGLNAEKFGGYTIDDFVSGNAGISEHIARDDHTDYLNITRHAAVDHKLAWMGEFNVASPQVGDTFIYRDGKWTNEPPSAIYNHDDTTGAELSTIHVFYIRNDINQAITNNITFDKIGVPFFVGIGATAKVNNLNADMIDDLHSTDLGRLASINQFTAQNSFVDVRVSSDGITVIPCKSAASVDREIWIGEDNHLWYRDSGGISRQIPIAGLSVVEHDDTLTGEGNSGSPLGVDLTKVAAINHIHDYLAKPSAATTNGLLFTSNGSATFTNGIKTDSQNRFDLNQNYVMNAVIDGGNLDL